MDVTVEFLTEQLRSKGIRPSYQRIKVLEYLHLIGGHPTVVEIFQSLAVDIPSLSKVTIYNTLHAFVEVGLVRIIDIDETEHRFDLNLTSHGHFQCEACRTIYNFEVNIEQVAVEGLSQFKIRQKNVYFKGLCPNCLKRSNRILQGETKE